MQILFLTRSLATGGAERQLLELMRRIVNAMDLALVTLYPGGDLWEEAKKIPRLRLLHLGKKGRYDLIPLWRLCKLLMANRPQVVHGYMVAGNLLALCAKPFGAKVIWGIRASNVDLRQYSKLAQYLFAIEARLSRYADLVICNSEAGRHHVLAHGFPAGKTIVIPNGIDTTRFAPDIESGKRLRQIWSIPETAPLVGLVARLDPMKGHKIFLRAAALIVRQRPEIRFVCVGVGPKDLGQDLQGYGEQLGLHDYLVWAGPSSDTPAVYNALQLAVSASIFGEGFSNTLAEAMSCGTPCVATSVGDAAQILGPWGRLVAPEDDQALAAAILATLDRPPDRQSIRKHITDNFSSTRLAQATYAAIRTLIPEHRQSPLSD